jgi:hypothetical protein
MEQEGGKRRSPTLTEDKTMRNLRIQGSASLIQLGIIFGVFSLTLFVVASRMTVLKRLQTELSQTTLSEQQALGLVQRYAMKKIAEFRSASNQQQALQEFCLQEPIWKSAEPQDPSPHFKYRCSLVNEQSGLFRFDGSFDEQRVFGSIVYGFSSPPPGSSDCPGLPQSGCPAPPTVTTNPTQWGSGTELDPYCICHPSQLDNLTQTAAQQAPGQFLLRRYFKLAADLDMTQSTLKEGSNNRPIGNADLKFAGVFFGNQKTIRNFKFSFNEKSTGNTPNVGAPLGIGLFRQLGDWTTPPIQLPGYDGVYRAIVKDLKIENIEILNQNQPNSSVEPGKLNTGGPVGGLAGLTLFAWIDGVQVSGKIGYTQNPSATSVYQSPTQNPESFPSHQATGGVVGLAVGTRIQNTELKEINSTTGSQVKGLYYTGGIVGHLGPPESLGVTTVFPKPAPSPFGSACNWATNLGQCPLPFVMSSVVEKSSVHGSQITSLGNAHTGPGYTGGIAGRSVDSPIKEVRVFQESGAPATLIQGVNRVGGVVGAILKDYLRPALTANWDHHYPILAEDDGVSFPTEPQLCPNSCTSSVAFGGGGSCGFGVMVYLYYGSCQWCADGALRLFRASCEGATIESTTSNGIGGIAGVSSIVLMDQAYSNCTVRHAEVPPTDTQYNPLSTNYLGMGGLVGMIHHTRIRSSEFSGTIVGGNAWFNFMGGIFGNLYGAYSSQGNPSNGDGANGDPHSSDLCMTSSTTAIPAQHTCLRRQLNLASSPQASRVRLRHSHNRLEAARMSGVLQGITSSLGTSTLNLRLAGIGNVNALSNNTQSVILQQTSTVGQINSSFLTQSQSPLTIAGGLTGARRPFVVVQENLFSPTLPPSNSTSPAPRLLVADFSDAIDSPDLTDNFTCKNFHREPVLNQSLSVLENATEDDGDVSTHEWQQLEQVGFFRTSSPLENVTQYTSDPKKWDVWKQTESDMMGNANGLDIDRPWRIIWRANLTDTSETPYSFNEGMPVPRWCIAQTTAGPTGKKNVCKPF